MNFQLFAYWISDTSIYFWSKLRRCETLRRNNNWNNWTFTRWLGESGRPTSTAGHFVRHRRRPRPLRSLSTTIKSAAQKWTMRQGRVFHAEIPLFRGMCPLFSDSEILERHKNAHQLPLTLRSIIFIDFIFIFIRLSSFLTRLGTKNCNEIIAPFWLVLIRRNQSDKSDYKLNSLYLLSFYFSNLK